MAHSHATGSYPYMHPGLGDTAAEYGTTATATGVTGARGGSHLLLLGCSQTKRHTTGLLPAHVRYDGVAFRVLRKARRDGCVPPGLRVLILSAEFGLLPDDMLLPWYDRKMTEERARDLYPAVREALARELSHDTVASMCICLGATYHLALGDVAGLATASGCQSVTVASGGIGRRLGQLRRWLRQDRI